MSTLYDHKNKQWIQAADADVDDLVKSGRFTFEGGIEIPVVAPDGRVGSIPSEKAYEAFNQGVRWQTADDTKAWEAAEERRIVETRGGDASQAAAAGFMRQYVPGFDTVLQATAESPLYNKLADTFGLNKGTAEDVREGLNLRREAHPGVTLASEITGAITSPIGKVLGAQAFKAGEGLVKGTGLVDRLAAKGLGSGFEGAYFGLVDGMSEAALGAPDEVAENLVASTGAGFLFGAATGGLLQAGAEMAPTLKRGVSYLTGKASDLTDTMFQKSASAALNPVLTPAAEEEAAKAARGFIKDKGFRDYLYNKGGAAAVRQAADDLERIEKEYLKQTRRSQAELTAWVQQQPAAIQRTLDDAITHSAGNATGMLNSAWGRVEAAEMNLVARLKEASQQPGTIADDLFTRTGELIDQLSKSKDRSALALGRDLKSYLAAQLSASGAVMHRSIGQAAPKLINAFDAGTEVLIAREVRNRIRNATIKSGKMASLVSQFDDDLAQTLYKKSAFGDEIAKVDNFYNAFDAARSFLSGKAAKGLNVKDQVIRRLVDDPEFATKFDDILSNFQEYAPEFLAIKQAGKNLAERKSALISLQRKIDDASVRGNISLTDLEAFAKALDVPKDLADRLMSMRANQDLLSEAAMGPASKYIGLLKAMGKPVTKEMQELAKYESQFSAVEKLIPKSDPTGYFRGFVDSLRRRATNIGLRSALGATIGGAVSQDFGIGMGAGALAGAAASPYRILKTLTTVERQFNKGYKNIERASNFLIDTFTSGKLRKPATISGAVSNDLGDRRKTYHERVELLKRMADPATALQEIERRVPQIEGAPNIQMAMSAQMAKTASFLQSKIPKDPFEGEFAVYKTPWEPSDFELAQFERYVDAADNPASVIDRMADGTVTEEELETLQTLYPQIFDRLRTQVLDAIMKPDAKTSYDQRLMLNTVFDVPTDPTLTPEIMGSLQQTYAERDKGPQGAQGAKQAPKTIRIDLQPEATQTEVERVTYK